MTDNKTLQEINAEVPTAVWAGLAQVPKQHHRVEQIYLSQHTIFAYGALLPNNTDIIICSPTKRIHNFQWKCKSCNHVFVTARTTKLHHCICGINGEFISDDTFEKEYGIKLEGTFGNIAPSIPSRAIKYYMHDAPLDLPELYRNVRDTFLYFMDFGGETETADLLACWTISTYVYRLFDWYPHLLLNAPSGSGKTKGATVVYKLAFRGYDLGASAGVTPAQIFRTLDENLGTIFIDEFERTSGQNASQETERLVCQLLNASCTRDAYVIRLEQDSHGKWRATKFPIYTPIVAANITGINPTSLSRFIGCNWQKTADVEKSARNPSSSKYTEKFSEIQTNLYLFGLRHWQTVLDNYESMPRIFSSREGDNWQPLFAIAKTFDDLDTSLNIQAALLKYHNLHKESEIETQDIESEFFLTLCEFVGVGEMEYTPSVIAESELIAPILSDIRYPERWVGRTLKKYRFPKRESHGRNLYGLSKINVGKVCALYFKHGTTVNNTPNTPEPPKEPQTPEPPHTPNTTNNDISIENSTISPNSGVLGVSGVSVTVEGGALVVYQNCYICQKTPCLGYHKGKPICQQCACTITTNGGRIELQ